MLELLIVSLLQAAAGPVAETQAATPAQTQATPTASAGQTSQTAATSEETLSRGERQLERRCRIVPITGSRVGRTLSCQSETDREVQRDIARRFINTTTPFPGG